MAKFESVEFEEKLFQAIGICKSINLNGEVDGIQFADLLNPVDEADDDDVQKSTMNHRCIYIWMKMAIAH